MALAATRTGSPQALGPGRDGREAVAADASRGSRESLSRPPSLTGAETRETVWPIRTQIDDSIAVLVRLTGNVAARPPRARVLHARGGAASRHDRRDGLSALAVVHPHGSPGRSPVGRVRRAPPHGHRLAPRLHHRRATGE